MIGIRHLLIWVVIVMALASGVMCKQAPDQQEAPVGRWQCVAKAPQAAESLKFYLAPVSAGGKLGGKIRTPSGNFTITGGSFDKSKLLITVKTAEGVTGRMSGNVKENKLSGEWSLDNDMSGTFECYSVAKGAIKPDGGQ